MNKTYGCPRCNPELEVGIGTCPLHFDFTECFKDIPWSIVGQLNAKENDLFKMTYESLPKGKTK